MNHLRSRSQLKNSGSMISIRNQTPGINNGLKEPKKMEKFMEHQGVLQERLSMLKGRQDNWDDEGSKAPTPSTVKNADYTISNLLYSVIDSNSSWLNPFISSDLDGEITAVWHSGERELHLQIGEEEKEVEYFKVWGINIDTQMEVGSLTNEGHVSIWQWLISGE